MPELNALPLLLTISETFTAAEAGVSLEARILHAAVHGWMEGHLSSPGHRFDPGNVGTMPEPPFPDPNDQQLHQIVEETMRRFREGEEPAAAAFAAALGWQAGRATAGSFRRTGGRHAARPAQSECGCGGVSMDASTCEIDSPG